MKQSITLVVRLFLFWMIFFFIQRLVFLSVQFQRSNDYSLFRVPSASNFKALSMDLAAASYLASNFHSAACHDHRVVYQITQS
jgi:hypothetical protein